MTPTTAQLNAGFTAGKAALQAMLTAKGYGWAMDDITVDEILSITNPTVIAAFKSIPQPPKGTT